LREISLALQENGMQHDIRLSLQSMLQHLLEVRTIVFF